MESVKEVPQERLLESIEVPNRNTPIPHGTVASAPVVEYFAPVIECGSSSSSAAQAARTSTDDIDEQLTNMFERIERRTEEIAMLTKRYVEELPQPTLTSPTNSEEAPSKRRRRTQYAPLPGALQDAVRLTPSV